MSKYSVLNLQDFTSVENVKNSFKHLSLKYHPDKQRFNKSVKNELGKDVESRWLEILNAYETLSDPILKTEYDLSLKMILKNGPIQEVVDLDDMEQVVGTLTNSSGLDDISAWKKPCRCGGSFFVTEKDLENGIDVVECDGCSLYIKLLYQKIEE